jgi:hypothetical protein
MITLRNILIICFVLVGTNAAEAQKGLAINTNSYQNAIGLRAGPTSGLTFKHFMGNNAIEGILGFWHSGFSLTGLYEVHASAGVPGLKWYYGGGGHIAAQPSNYYYRTYRNDYYYRYRDQGVAIGVDGIVGLEYKIKPIPFAISLDIKPLIEINNHGDVFTGLDPGLGIKLTF